MDPVHRRTGEQRLEHELCELRRREVPRGIGVITGERLEHRLDVGPEGIDRELREPLGLGQSGEHAQYGLALANLPTAKQVANKCDVGVGSKDESRATAFVDARTRPRNRDRAGILVGDQRTPELPSRGGKGGCEPVPTEPSLEPARALGGLALDHPDEAFDQLHEPEYTDGCAMSDRTTDTAVTGSALQAPDDDLPPGTVVENFRIECTLGRGGMSTVYGAVHTVIGKRGAIKVLKRELCTDDKEVERFVQEARAVNQIGHANIVDVFAFGVLADGRSYLIMEWLVGQSLRNRLRRGQLSRNEVREITLDIVRALEAAHAHGIIHRDLKPDNVFLVESSGERPRAKLLDFGVAKLTGEGRHDRTRVGSMLGTPQYLAPEQARGEAVLASDIYTLGVMLFELASGRPPFIGENSFEVVAMHLTERPPKLSSVLGGVTPELDALVDAMLAKEPADRPTLAQIKEELEKLVAKPKVPAAGMRTTLTTRRSTTKLALVLAGLVGALAMVVVLFVVLSASDHIEERREEKAVKAERKAEREERKAQRAIKPPEPRPSEPRPPEPKPPEPEPVVETGSLVIEWAGSEKLKFVVDKKPATANQAIELAPGSHELGVLRNRKLETRLVKIVAGQSTRIPIKPTTRAPSRANDDSLNPLNNGPR